jgi:hypothetical protein
MESLPNFKMRTREQHAAAFELHHDMAVAFERAVMTSREHDGAIALALDLLMLQGYKAHSSVRLLAECGHLEDAAALTHRLLEITARGAFVGGHEDRMVRQERAARYLGRLWSSVPEEGRSALPPAIRARWDAIREEAGPPSDGAADEVEGSEAVEHAGLAKEHAHDGALLSSLAHGAFAEQVLRVSQPAVEVRLAEQVGLLLVTASRYYLALAEQWNRVFGLIEKQTFESLSHRVRRWKPGHQATSQ